MSHIGKLHRGQKWLVFKDTEHWTDVSSDDSKMSDVNYFLENETSTDIDYSSKNLKELKATAKSLDIDDSKAKTKDDYVVLLEDKSDEVL